MNRVLTNPQVFKFMKTHEFGADLFHADRRTDRKADGLT